MVGGIIGLGLLATPAFAQDAGTVQELQRVIEAQQQQLEAQHKKLKAQQNQLELQQKQLDTQRQLLQELQSQIKSLAKDADKEAVTVTAEKPPEKPADVTKARPKRRAGISQADKHDRESPTSSNVTYFDPSKTTVRVPGTNTNIGVHGLAEF